VIDFPKRILLSLIDVTKSFLRYEVMINLGLAMEASKVRAEFSNLEIHMGNFRDRQFKMKCDVEYNELMLVMDGGKRVARLHARNIGNVHLERKGIRISAMNFEIREGDEVSVVSGSIKLELGKDSELWYKELWG
jgi:hypothetical protein